MRRACLWDEGRIGILYEASPDEPRSEVDVLIVGAGFTGLWTAYYLLSAEPNLNVTIIDAHHVGFGASGRNGGWCSPLLPMSLPGLARLHGRDTALLARRTMEDTVDEVGRRISSHQWDCDFVTGGSLEFLRNDAQVRRGSDFVDFTTKLGISTDEIRLLPRSELDPVARATHAESAVFDSHCAVLHPGKLVAHLARAVTSMGGRIHEGLPALALEPGRVVTARGELRADHILRTTEAFTSDLRGLHRAITPIYSMMIATEPLSRDQWHDIGLQGRQAFADGRRLLVYGQRTADGRIAFGGRGAPYHFGSRIVEHFDTDSRVARHLIRELCDLFPVLNGIDITHHWGGPLGLPRDWTCSIRYDRTSGMGSAGGYVGDGVATSNLAGRTLCDLVLGRDSQLLHHPWVHHRSSNWEPEPIRWFAINALSRLAAVNDRYERRRGKQSRLLDALFRRLLEG